MAARLRASIIGHRKKSRAQSRSTNSAQDRHLCRAFHFVLGQEHTADTGGTRDRDDHALLSQRVDNNCRDKVANNSPFPRSLDVISDQAAHQNDLSEQVLREQGTHASAFKLWARCARWWWRFFFTRRTVSLFAFTWDPTRMQADFKQGQQSTDLKQFIKSWRRFRLAAWTRPILSPKPKRRDSNQRPHIQE